MGYATIPTVLYSKLTTRRRLLVPTLLLNLELRLFLVGLCYFLLFFVLFFSAVFFRSIVSSRLIARICIYKRAIFV